MFTKMNPVLRGILMFILTGAAVLGALYVKALVMQTAFAPNWIEIVGIALVSGVFSAFAPNGIERRKDRR